MTIPSPVLKYRYQIMSIVAAGLAGCLLFCSAIATSQDNRHEATSTIPILAAGAEPIQPIPQEITLDPQKVALGKKLFNDPMLSHDNTISCSSCHNLSKGGTDGLIHSIGINHAEGGINAPTVLNSGLNYRQFWNGRAATLEDQVDGPTQHPKEMGSSWPEILDKLHKNDDYVAAFKAAYPDGIQHENVKDAIATYERSLITPNSPFDRFLRGDAGAISDQAKQGYRLFKDYGCTSCHQGVNMGGNMYQKMGVMDDYFTNRGNLTDADEGRYAVTHQERDRYMFRVPTLRNIALTSPYFHDGSACNLDAAVQTMARFQLGRLITQQQTRDIVAFLNTLTGQFEGGKP
jgi:cytochrome c peroxidase